MFSKANFKADCLTMFKKMRNEEFDEEKYADEFANLFATHLLTLECMAGQSVQTTGTSTAQTGTTTSNGAIK